MNFRHALGAFTLQEVIDKPARISAVPTLLLQQLYAQSASAVSLPDLQDSTREYLQYIRRELGQTLDVRRRADQADHQADQAEATTIAQDAPDQAADSPPAQSRDERIGEILRTLIALAAQPPDAGSNGNGGGRPVHRPTPPTRPTPPAMARPIADIDF